MSKDAGGHGSESRGGIGAQAKARAREAFRTGNYPGKDAIQRGGGPFDPKTGKDRYGNTAPGRTETDDAIRKGMAAEMASRSGEQHTADLAAQHGIGTDHLISNGVPPGMVRYSDPLGPEESNPRQNISLGSQGMTRFGGSGPWMKPTK